MSTHPLEPIPFADRFADKVGQGLPRQAQEEALADTRVRPFRPGFVLAVVDRLRDRGDLKAVVLMLSCVAAAADVAYVLKKCGFSANPGPLILTILDTIDEVVEVEKAAPRLLPFMVPRLSPEALGALIGQDGDALFNRRFEKLFGHSTLRRDALAHLTEYFAAHPEKGEALASRQAMPAVLGAALKLSQGDYSEIDLLTRAMAPGDLNRQDTMVRLVRRLSSVQELAGATTVLDLPRETTFEYPTLLIQDGVETPYKYVMTDTAQRVALVKGGQYVGRVGVLSSADTLLSDGLVFNEDKWTTFAAVSRVMPLLDQRNPEGRSELLQIPKSAERISGRIFPIGSNDNIFHFLVNHLPKLWFEELLEPTLGRDFTIVLESEAGNTFHHAFLALLGVDKSRVKWIKPGEALEADEIIVSTMPIFRKSQEVHRRISHVAMNTIRRRIHGGEPQRKGRRIFLKRGDVSHRRLINEAEIEVALTKLGFEFFDAARLTAAEQIGLMREASMVAGPNGAQMAIGMYAPSGAAFIDLTPNPTQSLFWFSLPVAAQHMRYYEVAGPAVPGTGRLVNADFSVDIAQLEKAVARAAADEPR